MWQKREKVSSIFSFEFPWEITGEMRLCFTAVFTALHTRKGERLERERERKAGSGKRKRTRRGMLRDAGETVDV